MMGTITIRDVPEDEFIKLVAERRKLKLKWIDFLRFLYLIYQVASERNDGIIEEALDKLREIKAGKEGM